MEYIMHVRYFQWTMFLLMEMIKNRNPVSIVWVLSIKIALK